MIFYETRGQAQVFLLLAFAGFFSAVLYDLLRLPRRFLPRWLAWLSDVVWWLFTAAACAMALSAGGESRARLYALTGLCAGACIYCLGIRTLIRAVWNALRK